jgi:hypothetical protein
MTPPEVQAVNKSYYKKEVNCGTNKASKSPVYHKPNTVRRKPQRQQVTADMNMRQIITQAKAKHRMGRLINTLENITIV